METDKLREALVKHEYVNGNCTCGKFALPLYTAADVDKYQFPHDIRWALWREHFVEALAASTPAGEAAEPVGFGEGKKIYDQGWNDGLDHFAKLFPEILKARLGCTHERER